MAKIAYIRKKFAAKSRDLIEAANAILEEYAVDGYVLTVRQLYYQFVARDILSNTEREYNRLGKVISEARLAGLIDWEYLTDRTRELRQNSHWDSPWEIVEVCSKQYAIDRWAGQEYRPEVWIEKDALIGILERVCKPLDVPFFSCRGYTSQSEMWAAGQRLREYQNEGKTPFIFHLGDHDPSGIDMSRDIRDRLSLFAGGGEHFKFERLALNIDQVEQYGPPPNPAKVTDTRYADYRRQYGAASWELDALEPKVIEGLVSDAIHNLLDADLWAESVTLEKQGRNDLTRVVQHWDEVQETLAGHERQW